MFSVQCISFLWHKFSFGHQCNSLEIADPIPTTLPRLHVVGQRISERPPLQFTHRNFGVTGQSMTAYSNQSGACLTSTHWACTYDNLIDDNHNTVRAQPANPPAPTPVPQHKKGNHPCFCPVAFKNVWLPGCAEGAKEKGIVAGCHGQRHYSHWCGLSRLGQRGMPKKMPCSLGAQKPPSSAWLPWLAMLPWHGRKRPHPPPTAPKPRPKRNLRDPCTHLCRLEPYRTKIKKRKQWVIEPTEWSLWNCDNTSQYRSLR